MQPTRPLQPALPFWMKLSDPAPPPVPPADPPQLYPFLSLGPELYPELSREEPPNLAQPSPGPLPPQVFIGSGCHEPREPDDPPELVYEFHLVGRGGPHGEPTDANLSFPNSITVVGMGHHRWHGWVELLRTKDETLLPALLPEQRDSLLVIARYLRALCRQGDEGIDVGEWPFFWVVFMDGFPPPGHLRRGEVHLKRVSDWLRNRYPHILGGE